MKNLIRVLFNTDSLKKGRLAWIDYAKGIAIILVAYRHILIGYERSGLEIHSYLMNANEMFYSFRMPLFFILSGIFISRGLAKRSVREFIINKWQILLYPYVAWCVIQVSLQILFSSYTNADRGWIDYTYMLTDPEKLDQMWYLFALFNVSVLFMLTKVYLKLKPVVQIFIGIVFYYLASVWNIGPQRTILFFYIFYAIGDAISTYMLNKDYYKFYASKTLFFALLPVFILSQWFFLQNPDMPHDNIFLFAIVALIGCAFMLSICFILGKIGKLRFLRIVGYHSLYIYVMHVLIVSALRTLMVSILGITFVPLLLLISLTLGMVLSIILYNIAQQLGFWYLFTLSNKEIPQKVIKKPVAVMA